MSTVDLQGLTWRKSSRSGGTGTNDNCVEIAFAGPVIAVRDSKNPAAGTLSFPATAFTSLRTSLQTRSGLGDAVTRMPASS